MSKLNSKIIVVTGGKGLLGREFVRHLTKEDAIVITVDKEISSNAERREIKCDITDVASIKNVLESVVREYGRIDGWVNNAYPRTEDWGSLPFNEESMESFETNVNWHLVGYVKCCQLVLNQMMKQKSGSLVNMTSIYGFNGPDFSIYEGTSMNNPSAYAAIKGGLINFSKYLAAFYGPYNVRVNCISPGGIYDGQPKAFVEKYSAKVPIKRMAMPEDISPSVSFLLADDSAYITGHNLVVDGGWSAI